MEPNNYNNQYGPEGPEIENALLLRYLIKRYDDLLESDDRKISPILGAISIASVALDKELESVLQRTLFPLLHPDHTLLQHCKDIFQRILDRMEVEDLPERLASGDDSKYPFLGERGSRDVLIMAISEGRKMIANDDNEFGRIVELLGWIALRHYPRRMAEFHDAWRSYDTDPGEAIRNGVQVLKTAFRIRNEEE